MRRFLFPSFEKPVERPRYLNIEPEGYDFRGIGTVLILAASCGVAIALWEPSYQVSSPFVTASMSPAAPAVVAAETTASADDEDDQPAPTVKLSAECSQRATARRDCAGVKAFKEARLTAPEPVATPAKQAPVAAVASKATAEPVDTVQPVMQPEAPVAQPQRTAAAPKVKRPRADDGPVERLVKVYDQVLPDGRRVPVYRRVGSGSFETGTIVGGEYRPTRRANLEPPAGRYFGLQ